MTVKEKMHDIIDHQPDDSSFDEILHELLFARMVERGKNDHSNGRVLSNEEVKNRMDKWQK
jgi:predicted transcriptional regulator